MHQSIEDRAAALVERAVSHQQCVREPGLTEAELDRAEETFGLTMPPLWRAVLRLVHPVELPMPPRNQDGILSWARFPDWRLRDPESTAAMINRPTEGVVFDVEHNNFWWHAWGERPSGESDRIRVARQRLEEVPRLVPLWINLYVASTDRSPVFSVHQTDVIIKATSLTELSGEWTFPSVPLDERPVGDVPFWSELESWGQVGHFDPRFSGLASAGRRA